MPKHITILYFGTLLAHSFVILMMKKVSSKLKNGGEDMKTKYIFLLSAMVIVLGLTGCDSKQTIVVTAVADEVEIPAGEDSIEIDVLANDSAIVDGYHDASTALYLGDIVIQPEHGSVTKNGNTVVYVTHADSEAISDQFTYEAVVDDNEGTKIKDIASVEISIQQDAVVVPPTEPEDDLNTKPVAEAMAIEMYTCDYVGENNAYTFTLTGHDDDGDSLTFTKVSDPNYGSILINEDGTGKYWLNNAEDQGNCSDLMPNSFTFKVNDSTVDSDPATVTLEVLPS